jgi:hypothetical protein
MESVARVGLQSCLCPTPELRSFHMAMVLPAFNALPQHLGKLMLWLQNGRKYATRVIPTWLDRPALGHHDAFRTKDPNRESPDFAWGRRSTFSQGQRPSLPASAPAHQPPLRGNWPFTVRPASAPAQPAPGPIPSGRSLLAAAVGLNRRGAFLPAAGPQGCGRRAPHAIRRFSEPTSGRLALSGRMEDVCAELDRLAACEATQLRQGIAT